MRALMLIVADTVIEGFGKDKNDLPEATNAEELFEQLMAYTAANGREAVARVRREIEQIRKGANDGNK
jgi:phytoene/squalene synthetase|nr:MAG TPA: hypothetical protein [Caudoviricetes sp.]